MSHLRSLLSSSTIKPIVESLAERGRCLCSESFYCQVIYCYYKQYWIRMLELIYQFQVVQRTCINYTGFSPEGW